MFVLYIVMFWLLVETRKRPGFFLSKKNISKNICGNRKELYICAIKQQQKIKTMSNTTSQTIEIFGNKIEAFTTLDAAWNASNPQGFWGTGAYFTNGQLWIVMSENHPVYLQILEAKNEWKWM